VGAEAGLEAARGGYAVSNQRPAPVVPFLDQRLARRKPMAPDGGTAIGTHAYLREAGDVPRHLLRFRAGAALGREFR
jgi:hypothetical protein